MGSDRRELRRLRRDGRIRGQRPSDGLGKTQGFGSLTHRDQAAGPGQRQDERKTRFHEKPPGSTDDRNQAALERPCVDQAIGGRNGVTGMQSLGDVATGKEGEADGGKANAKLKVCQSAAATAPSA